MTRTCCSTGARRPRRAGTLTGRSAGRSSRSSPGAREYGDAEDFDAHRAGGNGRGTPEHGADLGDGGASEDAAGGGRAGARGHVAGAGGGRVSSARVRGGAVGGGVHPGGDEPLERLLGRAQGRRYRGPFGPGAGDRRWARAAPAGVDRDVCDVWVGGLVRRVSRGGGGAGADRGRRGVDPRGRAVYGRAEAVRV